MVWLVLVPILGGLLALPVWLNARRVPVDEGAPWPGRSVALSQGRTRYRWFGGARGPVIVAIHGISTPSDVWAPLAARLAGLGFRVLTYDLFGRGGSADVAGRQDATFHLRQLRDLLAALDITGDIVVMGYSMGGQIAAAFAAEEAHRIRALVLIAPAGIEVREDGFDRFCRRVPLLGDWAHLVFGGRRLRAAARQARVYATEDAAEVMAVQHRQIERRGYLEAVLSSRRHLLSRSSEEDLRGAASTGLPVIAVWGEEDTVIPTTARDMLGQWVPTARQRIVPGAGHGLPFTHPDAVFDVLRRLPGSR